MAAVTHKVLAFFFVRITSRSAS